VRFRQSWQAGGPCRVGPVSSGATQPSWAARQAYPPPSYRLREHRVAALQLGVHGTIKTGRGVVRSLGRSARILGISRTTLWRHMKRLAIEG
jgi:hypothetical protein